MKKILLQLSGKKKELPPLDSQSGAFESRPGGWQLMTLPNGQRIRAFASRTRNQISMNLAGKTLRGELIFPSVSGGQAGGSESDLLAQFPGKIGKITVKEGAKVSAGETLLVLIAMKMEFPVQAPMEGTVSKLLVKEGDQVQVGQKFVDFQPTSKDSKK